MGAMKEKKQQERERRRPSGVVGSTADWAAVDAGKIRGAISIASREGGALRFGYTRDGGAYAIGVYGLGEPYTAYIRPGESVNDFLDDLAKAFLE